MNTFFNQPVPYYDHFLFKESLELKKSLVDSTKVYKLSFKLIKGAIKNLGKILTFNLEEESLEKASIYQNNLENTLISLKKLDDKLFDLQKNLQSNKLYDEDYQKQIRIECKLTLNELNILQNEVAIYLGEIEDFISEIIDKNLITKSSIWNPSEIWFNLQHLMAPEKRLMR